MPSDGGFTGTGQADKGERDSSARQFGLLQARTP
jgi:hypothetical protein